MKPNMFIGKMEFGSKLIQNIMPYEGFVSMRMYTIISLNFWREKK
jgi:hypothetical protein